MIGIGLYEGEIAVGNIADDDGVANFSTAPRSSIEANVDCMQIETRRR